MISTRFRAIVIVVAGVAWTASLGTGLWRTSGAWAADSRFAHSDSNARYLHWIDLYDADDRKITAESDRPYSSRKTCGRCHDYETVSHGWHFNAFSPDAVAGRRGEPWIWTDARTGTQLPLSYRDWSHTFDPNEVGITPWEMTKHFGGRLPGGGLAVEPPVPPKPEPPKSDAPESEPPEAGAGDDEKGAGEGEEDAAANRWPLTGSLEIDCLACHATPGTYDFNARRDQIAQENFAWAATAALRLGEIDGNVSRIKDGSDPSDPAIAKKLPKVTYDAARFSSDGTVRIDLIRKPDSNSCYQCHSSRTVSDEGIEPRWIHDDDVHLRAGMECADCHRNGIDHDTVRGFDGEAIATGSGTGTLSCAGCHLGADHEQSIAGLQTGLGASFGASFGADPSDDLYSRPGRLGSPQPLHAGLPPLHFEKMSCTACHGGPVPRDQALRMMTSLAHRLGSKDHRTGFELPAILGPVFTKQDDGRVYPHRAIWPAFWGVIEAGKLRPISPLKTYDVIRRALRVRKDFVAELLTPKLSSKDLKEILGEERAKVDPDQWTAEETAKFDSVQLARGRELFDEKVSAALEAIEKEWKADQAVYVSSGVVYARGDDPDSLQLIELDDRSGSEMISWPMAHNVRPAGWSLGVGGCVECHSESGKIFSSTVSPAGPGPESGEAVTMASLQGVQPDQRLAWNELFRGRKSFKYVVAASITILLMTLMLGIGAVASRFAGRQPSQSGVRRQP